MNLEFFKFLYHVRPQIKFLSLGKLSCEEFFNYEDINKFLDS